MILPAVVAGGLIALALSIDDFVITYFTAGAGASTRPVRIYSMVKRGVTPDINALSTLLLLTTLVVIMFALRVQRGGRKA
jgi:spermidine/putrescine transport system permease protein